MICWCRQLSNYFSHSIAITRDRLPLLFFLRPVLTSLSDDLTLAAVVLTTFERTDRSFSLLLVQSLKLFTHCRDPDLDKVWEMKPLVKGDEIMDVLRLKTGGPQVREWVSPPRSPSSSSSADLSDLASPAATPAAEVAARASGGGEGGGAGLARAPAIEAGEALLIRSTDRSIFRHLDLRE